MRAGQAIGELGDLSADVGHGERRIAGAQLRGALGLTEDDTVSLAWVREHVLATRARKGMVLDDADPDTHSAGSFFQNAVVSASFARTLRAISRSKPLVKRTPEGSMTATYAVRSVKMTVAVSTRFMPARESAI